MAAISPSETYPSAISNKSNGLEGLLQAKNKADQLTMAVDQRIGSDAKDRFDGSARGLQAYAATEKFQQSYAYSQTMTLALTTQEGDEITVDFRQLYARYQQEQQAQLQGPQGARYFESKETLEATAFEERFGFSIEGNLNEAELNVVFDVFKQVDQLASEFFGGDIERAFEKAQALNVDFGQLKNVSLDLQKKESAAVSYQQVKAYQAVETSQAETQEASSKGQISQLPLYLKNWQDVIERMDEKFANARDSFDQLMAASLAQRSGDSPSQDFSSWYDHFSRFHDKLAEVANLDKKTLKPSNLEVEPLIQSAETLAEKSL